MHRATLAIGRLDAYFLSALALTLFTLGLAVVRVALIVSGHDGDEATTAAFTGAVAATLTALAVMRAREH